MEYTFLLTNLTYLSIATFFFLLKAARILWTELFSYVYLKVYIYKDIQLTLVFDCIYLVVYRNC